MNTARHRFSTIGAGMAYALLLCVSAEAQDVEIFVGNTNPGSAAKPNILLILDTSGSMSRGTVLTQNDFDPDATYTGSCAESRVYWSTTGTPPACSTSNYFNLSALTCQRALTAFGANQGGSYHDVFGQFDPDQGRWKTIAAPEKDRLVECADDLPDASIGWPGHGGTAGSAAAVYPRNGNDSQPWTNDPDDASRIVWGANPTHQTYQLFSGKYMNWYYGAATLATKLEVMQDVAVNLINSINGVNIGLMHFDGSEGGLVAHQMEDISTARSDLESIINNLPADSMTPLQETLYEAYQYFTGGQVVYGGNGVAAARRPPPNDDIYASPMEFSCQKNHIVYLTDGWPTEDSGATSSILGLTDVEGNSFNDLVGSTCDVETHPSGLVPPPEGGDCLDDLAEFMYKADLSLLPGKQNVITHTVGFLVDLPILSQTAARGGGEYRTAVDTATLTTALTNIVTSILDTQATFTAPSISINAFNQSQHLDSIYVGLFRPSATTHWPGNLKKYRLRGADAKIVDVNNVPIIDETTGNFAETAQDFWSSTTDGAAVTRGGAAARLTATRNVYTYLGTSPNLADGSNAISTGNTALTDSLLNTTATGLTTRANVIDFINGVDVADADQDGDLTDARRQMGDPLHSRPVVVNYGPDNDDALVFIGTNDGYLHAINVDDGTEAWAFLPAEFLGNQVDLLVDNNTDTKLYGVDGGLRVQTIADSDGQIEESEGERVYLFFGMRRGGDAYYALDVTDPDDPKVMWQKDSSDLPGAGQSWSSVTPTRINIAGASQNANKLVLVIGGGYDPSQDAAETSTDATGNAIYIVDQETGTLLWHGARTGGTENFASSGWAMDYSIPADVRAIDLNSDGFADRMYAADMGGQVWRFDITNGNPPSSLVAGGVIAQLGAAGMASPDVADTRRFYYAPDVAVVTTRHYNFMHVGVGSGHRAHPNSTVTHDEFYALRDYSTFSPKTQAQYDAFAPIVPADLEDVTNQVDAFVPQGHPGWRLSLNDGGWNGEKVLAESRTFDGAVFISTYRPGAGGAGCEPALGTTRQYVVSLINAAPLTNLDGSVEDYNGDGIVDPTDLQLTDRYREFQGPPPPETVFFFPRPEASDTDGDGDIDEDDAQFSLSCAADGDCLGETPCQGLICFDDGQQRLPTRTIWLQHDID
ncbi:MAG TPA: PilC/PilY family type IV pilus protein [Gammaproteobacteria bacterium]|nr:PilC/PilY family type IV pilus protein [Gammaproteobacteria bacterium]